MGLMFRSFNFNLKVLSVIIGLSFLSDVGSFGYYHLTGHSTYWIVNTYNLLDTILVFFFFSRILNHRLVSYFMLGIILVMSGYYCYSVGVHVIWGEVLSMKNILVMGLCVLYFLQVFQSDTEIFLENTPLFWIVIGFIFYTAGSFFLWLMSSEIVNNPKYSMLIVHLGNILKNILFALGLWKARVVN